MQVNKTENVINFKNGFYNVTRELDASLPLSRAVVDMFGCDIPWIAMANNNTERKEKARKVFTVYGIAWLSPFLNNEITKKNSGQTGFSAEMKMAEKSVVENRAKNYEKSKRKKISQYTALILTVTSALSLAGFGAIYKKNGGKFINALKNKSYFFDYGKGIYMSRLPLVIGSVVTQIGYMLASRNKTERKDNAIRYSLSDAVFFGGDLFMASLLANFSDRLFKTKLTKDNQNTHSFIRKIFPDVKSFAQIADEVSSGKIKSVNKKVSAGIFWLNLALISVSMGYFIPKFVNRMIRKDVQKDVQTNIGYKSFGKINLDNFADKAG